MLALAQPDPAPQAEQSPLCPPAQGGGIGRARRIFAVRRCLLSRIAGGDVLTGLLAATQAEMRRGRQPIGQDGEGLPARLADSAPHPDAIVLVVVGLPEPPAVADDRVVAAERAQPRQQMQRHSPRLDVVFGLWQCDKKNHGWREGPPLTVAAKFRSAGRAFTLPVKSVSNEKRILLSAARREPSLRTLAGYKRQLAHVRQGAGDGIIAPGKRRSRLRSRSAERTHSYRGRKADLPGLGPNRRRLRPMSGYRVIRPELPRTDFWPISSRARAAIASPYREVVAMASVNT